jgi:hypothetical protein
VKISSRAETAVETEGWEMCRRFAASVIDRLSAAVTK